MLCLFNLFLVIFSGLLYKSIEQQNLLSLDEIFMVNGKEYNTILIANRYAQLVKIGINQLLYKFGIDYLYLCKNIHRIKHLALNILRQRVVKLIEFCTPYHSAHSANVIHLLHFTK